MSRLFLGMCLFFSVSGLGAVELKEVAEFGFFKDHVRDAFRVLNDDSNIGKCRWNVKFLTKTSSRKESLLVSFSGPGRRGPTQFEFRFSNDQSNRSKVKFNWGYWDWKWTHLTLERVDYRHAPAYKYHLKFSLDGERISALRVQVFFGSNRTVLEDYTCR